MFPSDPGPPHIAECWLKSVSYTSASIDWLPLETHGIIAPVDVYTLEVYQGATAIQRVELSGSTGLHTMVLPNVLQPHTLYNATLFGNNSAGRGYLCHVSFSTSEGLCIKHVLLWHILSMHSALHWGRSLHQVMIRVCNLPQVLYRELLVGCHCTWYKRVTMCIHVHIKHLAL